MAVTFLTGFEAQAALVDNITLTGTAAYNATTPRTGAAQIRCSPASGASGYITIPYASAGYYHFGLRLGTVPQGMDRLLFGAIASGTINVRQNAGTNNLSIYLNTTQIGSSVSIGSGWYWIGVRAVTGTSVPFLQVDGVTVVTGTATVSAWSGNIGYSGTETPLNTASIDIDDIIVDDAGFLAPSKVALLLPISDNARATLWTGGVGGTTSLYDAVNNTPPAGSATESNTTQIEHAGGAAGTTDAYDANMTTYTTAGVGATDKVIALQGVIVWGEDIQTGTKLLSYEGVSNPAWTGESSIDVSTGHGSGAVGTYATGADGWNERGAGIVTSAPPIVTGTASLGASHGPVAVCIDSTNTYVYVVNNTANTVEQIQISDMTVTGTVDRTGHNPYAVCIDSNDTYVYVANYNANTVEQIQIAFVPVARGTSPVMRVVRPETASRVASVCFMGIYVAWTVEPLRSFAQARAQIAASGATTNRVYAQSQAQIKTTYRVYAQSQAQIKTTYRVYAQAQAQIRQTYQVYAQAQGHIKQTYKVVAQANTWIRSISYVVAQAQAQIKTTYQTFAQAQSQTKNTYQVVAQANGWIRNTYRAFAQSNVWAKAIGITVYAQANAQIRNTYRAYAQSNAQIKQTYKVVAQANAQIRRTYQVYAQAQAHIKATYQGMAQANVWIKSTGLTVYAQAQSQIKQTYQIVAQAQVKIATTRVHAQAQVAIKQTYQVVAQSNAYIKGTSFIVAQAQAQVKQTNKVYAQALADIKQTYPSSGGGGTLVVYSDAADGSLMSADVSYATARAGANIALDPSGPILVLIGQQNWWDSDFEEYVPNVSEGFSSFDTSSIPDGDTVSAAVLRVTSSGDSSSTDFDIQARLRDWGTSLTTADYVPGANLSGLTLLGSYATSSGFTAGTAYDFADSAMAANVNKTGSTRMLLCSSHTTNNNAPTTTEYVSTYSADYTGTTYDPKLTVTYAAGATGPAWTTPADTVSMTTTPELKFTSPASAVAQHFYLQLDTANTFDSGNLRTLDSSTSQTSWDYWTGAAWAALPSTGLASGYAGNEIRYTVTSALSSATWYRRVRAGTLA